MTALVCPECRVGKHGNCDGGSWDRDTDQPTTCPCWKAGHRDEEITDD